MSAQPQGPTRYQRIEANCKRIWGVDKEFEIDTETDDYEYYACVVREDLGFSLGKPLTMTNLCDGPDGALNELDRMLRIWAKQVESGQPMTKEERLEVFSRPHGRHWNVLEAFLEKSDRRDALATEHYSLWPYLVHARVTAACNTR